MRILKLLKRVQKVLLFGFVLTGVLVTIINAYFYLTKPKNTAQYKPEIYSLKTSSDNFIKEFQNDPSFTKQEKVIKIARYKALLCGFVGEQCSKGTAEENHQMSVLGYLTPLLTAPVEKVPASGVSYAMYKLQNNDFIPQTYAYEGVGLASIRGYLKIWEVFRNFSYLLIVLLLVFVGFMIMFRWQIGGQTLVTIENALPRIVITLILITLSFPIAGAMIDLMYASMGAFVYIVASGFPEGQASEVFRLDMVNRYIGSGFASINLMEGGSSAISTGKAIYNVMPSIIQGSINSILGGAVNALLIRFNIFKFSLFTDIFKDLGASGGVSALGFGGNFGINFGGVAKVLDFLAVTVVFAILSAQTTAAGYIMGFLILITLLYFLFRLFFLLLGAYIKVVLLIIFAPLIILFQIIPGKNPFSYWIKTLFGELLTFPVVAVVLATGRLIIEINNSQTIPPLDLPFIRQGFTAADFGAIIGLGLILLIPELVRLLKGLLGIPELGLDIGVGMFFSGVTAVTGGVQQGLGSFGSIGQIAHLAGIQPKGKFFERLIPPTQAQLFQKYFKPLDPPAGTGGTQGTHP